MLSQTQDGAEGITTYNAAMCTINTPPQTVLIGVNTYSSHDHIRILTVCTVRPGRFVFHFIPLLYSCYYSCQPAGFTRLRYHRRFTLPTNSFNSVLWLFSEGKTERTAHCAFTSEPVFVPIPYIKIFLRHYMFMLCFEVPLEIEPLTLSLSAY